jgi:CIC family chloride channel protein
LHERPNSAPRLALLGFLSGLLAAGSILALRGAIEYGQRALLGIGEGAGYEALPPAFRLALPIATGLLLGLLFDRLRPSVRDVGVVHVLVRLRDPGAGRLPAGNVVTQFVGAVVAIVGGHSVDREGPAVHLGAGSASVMGRWLQLDAEEERSLIAAGAAAAIAAAFDTPLAGVIFAIEVLRVRYSVSRFLPVIVAAVVGAIVVRVPAFMPSHFIVVPEYLASHWEIPALVVLGAATGFLATGFNTLAARTAHATSHWLCVVAFPLAGLVTGLFALWTPEVMGVGYDTLEAMLLGDATYGVVVPLIVTKLLATAISVGLRVPGGLIGPTLVVGGAAGATLGLTLTLVASGQAASPGFYATIGMAAMMAATLRAPLAALTSLLEMTANPNIILPGMIAVASAEVVRRSLGGGESVFEMLVRARATPRHRG